MQEQETPQTVIAKQGGGSRDSKKRVVKTKGETARDEGTSLDLGPLNRNWYRRCLDVLDRNLRESPPDPSVDDVKNLCQKIVSGFLEAVTGQAPDSSQLQFPADRTYFIPFEDDIAETFHYAKPFYRFVADANETDESSVYPNSIWSFFPWPESKYGRVVIDSDSSVNKDGQTNPFEEMISARAQFKNRETKGDDHGTSQSSGNVEFQLEKSLIVRRDREENFLKEVYKGKHDSFRNACEVAIRAIFELYRLTPGNAAIEHILLNHVTIIRWILRTIREQQTTEAVLQQEQDYQTLFKALLRSLFLTDVEFGRKARDAKDEDLIDRLAARLRSQAEILESGDDDDEALKKLYAEQLRREGSDVESLTQEDLEKDLKKLLADLHTFRQYLLTVGSERRIEEDLVASLGADLPKAGDTRESFVWLIPDFENMDSGLPVNFEVKKEAKSAVTSLTRDLNQAYRIFFKNCDVACLNSETRRDQIQAYWRTLGNANRKERIFGSFEDTEVGMYVPELHIRGRKEEGQLLTASIEPRSQNFFLRVKICDSLGEPIINGLFVISSDHDEIKFKNKKARLLREDQEDLISFGKVYFFIVRDFFRALDRAQDARDIGRLNQYLYDRRLRDLDDRMQRRVTEKAFRELGLAEKHNWAKFVYEVFNNYAYSLIQKPEEVKTETFPYDRLLILPLEAEYIDDRYSLPFHLFQAIFVERNHGEIDSDHYSLIKPFQSPVEELGNQESTNRFRSKSFQVFSSESYLEKLYLGAESDADRGAEEAKIASRDLVGDQSLKEERLLPPESYVPKLIRAHTENRGSEQSIREYSQGEFLEDWGRDWAVRAITSFWSSLGCSEDGMKVWRDFLYGLTATYRYLKYRKREAQKLETEDHWFLLRFGLLRAILRLVDEQDEKLKSIIDSYKTDLRLRFDADERLDVIRLARTWNIDPFSTFDSFLPFLREAETADIQFAQFKLGGGGKVVPDSYRFVLRFFQHLTELICNKNEVAGDNQEQLTWYQPLLTRPFYGKADSGPLALHREPSAKIGKRLPPYKGIEEGEHSLSMFLGFSNFRVGRGMQRSRIRCLTVMVRDYDDSKTGASISEEEIKGQLEIDLRDLGLYTSTFFRNVQKFGADTMAGEDIRVLSTDVTQIARNWYSTGMDEVTLRLRKCVDRLLEDRLDFRFGRLRPEVMDEFFDSLVDVLTREERKPSGERDLISLESFPFDRAIHIPLTGDSSQGMRLGYTRTKIVHHGNGDLGLGQREAALEEGSWNYDRIRREGRSWTREGWAKTSPGKFHFDLTRGAAVPAPDSESIHEILSMMARIGDTRFLDLFVRCLYEADAIQTLAVAGLICHMLRVTGFYTMEKTRERIVEVEPGLVSSLSSLALRLRTVITDSYRSIERADGGVLGDVFSEVYMSREAFFPELSFAKEVEIAGCLGDTRNLPAWLELFRLAEDGRKEWVYGLRDSSGQSVRSKVFFVFYSMSAPESLGDVSANTRYRGIYSFVVDDARTDRKDEESETADQQDIRTLIHNSVRGLRQMLDIQGLANRNRQPGIERFVLGMLHRMKNELNHPVIELRELAKQAKKAKRDRDRERIESVAQTLTGFEELFQGLKKLSDHEQDQVPLRQFSTNWLGWFFVFQLCEATLSIVQNSRLESTQSVQEGWIKSVQGIASYASEEKIRDSDSVYSVELIQRKLGEIEEILASFASCSCSVDARAILSFQVFAERPMAFLGSFLLEEALIVLVENAFQAFWSDLISCSNERRTRRPVGLIKLVCRRGAQMRDGLGSEASGDVLLEITNSSSVVADSILEVLNAEVPQPMTKHQHQSKSGKKGGSGFGHYYARRIVRGFCGGQEERRKLDIDIRYNPETSQTRVVVNLIDSSRTDLREVTFEGLQQELEAVFHTTVDGEKELAGQRYCLPASIRVKSLLEVARNILISDRQQTQEDLFAWLNASVCGRIARCCDEVRSELIEVLREKVEKANGAENGGHWAELLGRIEIDGTLGVRRSSYADLTAFLDRWRKEDSASLDEVVASRPFLKKVLDGERADAMRFIKSRYRKGIRETFKGYSPFLKSERANSSLDYALAALEVGAGGIPAPSRQRVEDMFLPVREEIRVEPIAEGIHLALSYNDGSAVSAFEPGRRKTGTEEHDDFVVRFRLGSTFRSYSRTFRSFDENGDGFRGALWLDLPSGGGGRRGCGVARTVHIVLRSRQSDDSTTIVEVK